MMIFLYDIQIIILCMNNDSAGIQEQIGHGIC